MAPFGELGEQQGPIAGFDHLLEDFFEPLNLGAAGGKAGVHPLLLQGQGRGVADLLELGEQGQHLAVFLAQGRAGDRIEALLDGFVVKLFLLRGQAHPFAQFHLFG